MQAEMTGQIGAVPVCRQCGCPTFQTTGGDGKRCATCGFPADVLRVWETRCECGHVRKIVDECPKCGKQPPVADTGPIRVMGPEQIKKPVVTREPTVLERELLQPPKDDESKPPVMPAKARK